MTTSKRSSERSAAMVLIFVIASSILVACAGGRADTGTSSGEVVLYTSVPEAIVDRLAGVVERRFPDLEGNYWVPAHGGISLRAVRGRTADIQQRIAEDIESTGGIQADVIWLAEPYPVRTDVAPPLGASPLADITALDVDWEALAGEADAIAQLWEDVYGREARTGARRVTYL